MADVVSLPHTANQALSSSRKVALPAVESRIVALYAGASFAFGEHSSAASYACPQHRMTAEFTHFAADDVYFRVRRDGTNLMTGRLRPRSDPAGAWELAPSKWARGWEAALFQGEWHPLSTAAPVVQPPARRRRDKALSGPVVRLPDPRAVATGRNRDEAARVILARLRRMLEAAGTATSGNDVNVMLPRLRVSMTAHASGLHVRVVPIDWNGRVGLTAVIDPTPAGQYADGHLHVMTWNRGWEAALFA